MYAFIFDNLKGKIMKWLLFCMKNYKNPSFLGNTWEILGKKGFSQGGKFQVFTLVNTTTVQNVPTLLGSQKPPKRGRFRDF